MTRKESPMYLANIENIDKGLASQLTEIRELPEAGPYREVVKAASRAEYTARYALGEFDEREDAR